MLYTLGFRWIRTREAGKVERMLALPQHTALVRSSRTGAISGIVRKHIPPSQQTRKGTYREFRGRCHSVEYIHQNYIYETRQASLERYTYAGDDGGHARQVGGDIDRQPGDTETGEMGGQREGEGERGGRTASHNTTTAYTYTNSAHSACMIAACCSGRAMRSKWMGGWMREERKRGDPKEKRNKRRNNDQRPNSNAQEHAEMTRRGRGVRAIHAEGGEIRRAVSARWVNVHALE